VPQHHPLQRRRYRIRRLHRATPASGGTFSPLNPPAPTGAPARLAGQTRDVERKIVAVPAPCWPSRSPQVERRAGMHRMRAHRVALRRRRGR
jgi:hypothetical protein